ncbi:MAG: hypothetical protein J6K43_13540 [Lachnospiraceae bacterium]|nr:hypothetical protein [Lachnospiraceae bacterium]
MYKKLILLLVTLVLAVHLTGCGNKKNQESTDVESAVDNSTADSDNDQIDVSDLPALPGTENDEPVVYEPADLSCVLPKGFKALSGEEGIYVYKTYPKDISTISYVISESDEDITQMTKDEYKKMMEEDFLDAYGDEVDVKIHSYDKIRVDKRNGIRIKLEYDFKGVTYEQLNYMIFNGDESHIMSFTQEADAGWMDDFEKSGESLHFVAR